VAVLEKCLQCFLFGILPKCWYFSRQFFKSACNVAYYWHLEKSAGISPAVIF
jgi:hypothetical protein